MVQRGFLFGVGRIRACASHLALQRTRSQGLFIVLSEAGYRGQSAELGLFGMPSG
jgi:hypothetical protein